MHPLDKHKSNIHARKAQLARLLAEQVSSAIIPEERLRRLKQIRALGADPTLAEAAALLMAITGLASVPPLKRMRRIAESVLPPPAVEVYVDPPPEADTRRLEAAAEKRALRVRKRLKLAEDRSDEDGKRG